MGISNSKYKMKMGQIILLAFLVQLFACNKGKEEPVLNEDPNAVRIANHGFETVGSSQTPAGWNTIAEGSDQDADFTKSSGKTGSYCLTHSKNSAYKVYTY